MRSFLCSCVFVLLSIFSLPVFAQDGASDATKQPQLSEKLKVLSPFVGTWIIDSAWDSGAQIWAKNVYSVGMGGNFLEARTYTKNEDGKVYQRYLTIWQWDEKQSKVVSHGFTYDGTYDSLTPTVEDDDGKPAVTSMWTPPGSEAAIRQTVKLIDEDSYSWKVWSVTGDEETQMMDGVWKRQN